MLFSLETGRRGAVPYKKLFLCERFWEGVQGEQNSFGIGSPCILSQKATKKEPTDMVDSYFVSVCINYLYLRFLAASDFFLRFTLGFS